jgi:hypothetical protein
LNLESDALPLSY